MTESIEAKGSKNPGSKVARAFVRIVGIGVGCLGLLLVCIGFACMKDLLGHGNKAIGGLLSGFLILEGFYYIYVTCILVFRFSRAAIKQLCGIVSYNLFRYFGKLLKYLVGGHYSGKYDELLYTGFSILAAIAFYTLSSRLLLKWSMKEDGQGKDDRPGMSDNREDVEGCS